MLLRRAEGRVDLAEVIDRALRRDHVRARQLADASLEQEVLDRVLHQVIVDRVLRHLLVVLDSLRVVAVKRGEVSDLEPVLVREAIIADTVVS